MEIQERMQGELRRDRITVSPYTERDIPEVLAFERQLREEESDWGWQIDEAYVERVSASFRDRRFENALSFLAHFDGSVKAYLDWICVLKSSRHQGAAQKLLSALRERLKALGVDTLIALTAGSDEAQRFYRSVPDSIMRDLGIWIDVK